MLNKDELKPTTQAIERCHMILVQESGGTHLLAEVGVLFQFIRY